MRIIVMLKPTNKRGTKTAYTKFREYLKKDGYVLIQPEVYMRTVTSRRAVTSHLSALSAKCPKTGTVRVLTLTEKQYGRIVVFSVAEDFQDSVVGARERVDL